MSGGRYQAYPEYKDSGVEWLEPLPTHWRIQRTKMMFQPSKNLVGDRSKDYQLLSLTLNGVIPRDITDGGGKIPAEFNTYQEVEPSDLVFCLFDMDETPRTVGISNQKGMITGAYSIYKCVPNCAPRYAFYYFLHIDSFKGLRPFYTGLRKVVRPETFGNILMPTPSISEQTQIANFLDHETAQIDTLIEKQRNLIALLKEKRQAVISHAVTKGLNPDAPMKDSGVEWLGEVPEHWIVQSLSRLTIDKCDGPFGSGLKSEHYTENGVRVIRLQNIKLDGYNPGDGAFISEDHYKHNLSNHDVIPGDLLIAGLGDPHNPVGRACVAPDGIAQAMVKADCFRFRLDIKKSHPEFIAKQLCVSAKLDAGRLSNGSTRARIPLNTMATRKVVICSIEEQITILEYLETKLSIYKKTEKKALEVVKLLQERRTALISAAVTGKIDVRNWQPPAAPATTEATP